jgi:internalin A
MERWLAFVAFDLQRRRAEAAAQPEDAREILIHWADLLKLLVEEMPKVGGAPTETEAVEFLDFAAKRSGLLLPRGESQFAFMHLSFQEYFAARFLEEQITSLKWARGQPTYPGTSAADLNKYADIAVWTETMVLLFELLKPKPQWTEALRDALFGERYEILNRDEGAPARAKLLAEVLIDPHTGLEPFERKRDIPAIIDWEIRGQQRQQWYVFGTVFPTILLPSGFEPEQRIAAFWERMQRAQPLERLNLNNCVGVADLAPFAQRTKLQSLSLSGCVGVADLAPLAELTNLQFLDLSDCVGVTDFSPLTQLTKLEILNLSDCVDLTDLAPLAQLTELVGLSLDSCVGVADLAPLAKLTNLQFLNLNHCVGVEDLAPLAKLTNLRSLYLSGCGGVANLAPLRECTSLRELYLVGCVGVADLAPLAKLTRLERLDLRGTSVSTLPVELQRRGVTITQ